MLFCNNRHVKLFCIFLAQNEKLILQIKKMIFTMYVSCSGSSVFAVKDIEN